MPEPTTENRTFVGEPASQPGSGYAGFTVGITYCIVAEYLPDGTVAILPQGTLAASRVVVSQQLFERWWIKQTGPAGARWGKTEFEERLKQQKIA